MSKRVPMLCLAVFAGNAMAANINIGPNGCTLDDAIRAANTNSAVGNCASGSGSDFIIAPDGWVVTLTSALPTITSDLTLRSASAAGILTIDGNDGRRVLKVTGSNTNVTLLRVQLVGGRTRPLDTAGSAIRIENATVRFQDSIVSSNVDEGYLGGIGAIFVTGGSLTLDRSRVQDNDDTALRSMDSAVRIVDSTFTRNRSGLNFRDGTLSIERSLIDEHNFAIIASGAIADITNTTVQLLTEGTYDPWLIQFANNSIATLNHVTAVSNEPLRLYSSFLIVSNSIIGRCELYDASQLSLNVNNLYHLATANGPPNCLGQSPGNLGLLPLADNGGPTRTRAIGNPNSAAINAGDAMQCEALDQRGEVRDAACDVGAFEATDLADVSVTASIQPAAPYVSNQQLIYYAAIQNSGPGPATHVEIDMDIAGALVTGVDSAFCPAIPCVVTSIQAGQTLVIPVEMTLLSYLSSPLLVDLSAHSTSNSTYGDADEDNPSGNNRHSVSRTINQGADLAITLNLTTAEPYFNGQALEYAALIENLGPQTASGIELQFAPSSLTGVAFSGCTPVSSDRCNVASIASGGSRSVTIQAVVANTEFNAVGSVSGSQIDIDTSNNIDNSNNGGGVFKSDIAVGLTLQTDGPFYSLQYLSFDIAIATGIDPASNIQLFYEFPGAELIDIQGCSEYPCVIPSMAANTEIHRLAQFFAPLAMPGLVDTLSLRVLATPGQSDPDLSNNEVTVVKPLGPSVDVAAQLSLVSAPPFLAGQEIEYALRLPNAGPNTATSVDITLLPQNLTLSSAFGNLCQTVDCTITRLSGFDEENIVLIYQIEQPGAFDLTAATSANEFDTNTSNNTDSTNNGGTALPPPIEILMYSDGFE